MENVKGTNISFDHTCEPCSLDNNLEIVKGFCVICVDYLCEDCVKSHRKNKATRNHTILCDNDLPDNKSTYQLLANTLLCKLHSDREVQFECKDHREFICALCLRQAHRHCDNVDDIDELVDENRDKETCKQILNRYEDEIKTVELFRNRHKEHIVSLTRQNTTNDAERKLLFHQIHESLSKLGEKLDKKSEEHIQLKRQLIQESMNKYCKPDENRKRDYELLALSFKYANSKQLAVQVKTMKQSDFEPLEEDKIEIDTDALQTSMPSAWKTYLTQVRDTLECARGENKNSENNDMNVLFDKNTSARVSEINNTPSETRESDECDLNEDRYTRISTRNVGTQTTHTSENKPETQKSPAESNIDTNKGQTAYKAGPYHMKRCQSEPLIEREVKLMDAFFSESPTGCVKLPDSRFVFVNNSEIKVHDADFRFLFRYELSFSAYTVCGLNDDKIAITYCVEKRIDIFQILKDKIEMENSLSMECYCRGITAMWGRDQCIAVLCSDKDAQECIDSGEIRIIKYTSDRIWEDMGKKADFPFFQKQCRGPINIENPIPIMSYSKEQFFIGDNAHVLCYDMECNALEYFKGYKGHSAFRITGLTADNEGNIYACCESSNNVHQMRAGNLRENRVLIEKICEPIWIVFDTNKERLLIGCGDGRIRVYNFQ